MNLEYTMKCTMNLECTMKCTMNLENSFFETVFFFYFFYFAYFRLYKKNFIFEITLGGGVYRRSPRILVHYDSCPFRSP